MVTPVFRQSLNDPGTNTSPSCPLCSARKARFARGALRGLAAGCSMLLGGELVLGPSASGAGVVTEVGSKAWNVGGAGGASRSKVQGFCFGPVHWDKR